MSLSESNIVTNVNHFSSELKCPMNFAIYLPEQTEKAKVPALYYLSGNATVFILIIPYVSKVYGILFHVLEIIIV